MTPSPGRGPGRPLDPALRERRSEEILDVATRLFAERGFHQTDLQVVADQLGVGKGTIYRYFPSKEDLFLAAIDRGLQQLKATIDARVEVIGDPMERMAGAIAAYLEFFADHGNFVELLIQERAAFKDERRPRYFEYYERDTGPWRLLLQNLIAQGRVRPVPVDRILTVMGDLLYGTMFTNYFSRRRASVKTQVADILDIVFHGILSDQERGRSRHLMEARPTRQDRR